MNRKLLIAAGFIAAGVLVFANEGAATPEAAAATSSAFKYIAAAIAVDADKVCVAELADGASAITLEPAPQVAAGKAQEHGCAAGVCALALQCVEAFLDRVRHGAPRHLAQPFARRSHAGHVPHP